ncbi:signal peptidase II [Pseudactinotalea sp.]|uniref:signal peptidase II n=1 Tax=Pseudactinotalea sp. TaxID=1926260 RepID=UPI003B3B052C
MSAPHDQPRRRRLLVALGLLAAGVLVVDQVSKSLVVARMTPGEYIPLLGDFFGLQLVFNPGAAFSLATGSTWIFTIVATVVTVVIVRISRKLGSRGWAIALGSLLGGNLGNLGDRLFRDPGFARGHVVDFLNYNGWFVGNVADIAIVLAAVMMALLAFLGIGIDGTRHAAAEAEETEEEASEDDASSAVEEDEPTAVVEKDAD